MVLQRDQPLVIKGMAKPHEGIAVNFKGMTLRETASKNGEWSVTFPAQAAGGPYILKVDSRDNQVEFIDVYVGDVWLASGQSNMEWKLKWRVNNWQQEVEDSDFPMIRYFDVPNRFSSTEKTTLDSGQWQLAHPKNTADFSAIAWLFAKQAHIEKNVPIGIIDSSWGGTPAEAWVPKETLFANTDYAQETTDIYSDDIHTINANFKSSRQAQATKATLISGTKILDKIDITSMAKHVNWSKMNILDEQEFTDIVWFKKSFNVTADMLKDAKNEGVVKLDLGLYPKMAHVYVNGQKSAVKPGDTFHMLLDIPISKFNVGENIIAVRGLNDWSNKFKFGKPERMYLAFSNDKIPLSGEWAYNTIAEPKMPKYTRYWQKPATLYNGMIHPIVHYPVKGVIWYQGESNTRRAGAYADLFKDLISSWRERWNAPNLPFLFVQLAGFHPIQKKAVQQSFWADLREAQTQALALPHTGMAIALDVGDEYDIHPRDKHTVAKRLWRSARGVAYGEKILTSGPVFRSVTLNGNVVKASFTHIGEGFEQKSPLLGFELAGEDGQYVKANAIYDGNTVLVSVAEIDEPKFIRYGWSDNTDANLYNKEGLPALPFRHKI